MAFPFFTFANLIVLYLDENIEELAELLAYIVQGALVIWYHCQLKHVDKEGISM
jgi:hypothetical protein